MRDSRFWLNWAAFVVALGSVLVWGLPPCESTIEALQVAALMILSVIGVGVGIRGLLSSKGHRRDLAASIGFLGAIGALCSLASMHQSYDLVFYVLMVTAALAVIFQLNEISDLLVSEARRDADTEEEEAGDGSGLAVFAVLLLLCGAGALVLRWPMHPHGYTCELLRGEAVAVHTKPFPRSLFNTTDRFGARHIHVRSVIRDEMRGYLLIGDIYYEIPKEELLDAHHEIAKRDSFGFKDFMDKELDIWAKGLNSSSELNLDRTSARSMQSEYEKELAKRLEGYLQGPPSKPVINTDSGVSLVPL